MAQTCQHVSGCSRHVVAERHPNHLDAFTLLGRATHRIGHRQHATGSLQDLKHLRVAFGSLPHGVRVRPNVEPLHVRCHVGAVAIPPGAFNLFFGQVAQLLPSLVPARLDGLWFTVQRTLNGVQQVRVLLQHGQHGFRSERRVRQRATPVLVAVRCRGDGVGHGGQHTIVLDHRHGLPAVAGLHHTKFEKVTEQRRVLAQHRFSAPQAALHGGINRFRQEV